MGLLGISELQRSLLAHLRKFYSFLSQKNMVEPVCIIKKKFLTSYLFKPVCGIGIRGTLKILKGIKLILDDQGNHLDSYNQFGIIQVLQRSTIPQTSNWSGTFLCCFLRQTGSRH